MRRRPAAMPEPGSDRHLSTLRLPSWRGALADRLGLVLKHVPDWRWMLDREDSPWYPTMRLFRQETDGDWKSAFDKVERELRSLAGGVSVPETPARDVHTEPTGVRGSSTAKALVENENLRVKTCKHGLMMFSPTTPTLAARLIFYGEFSEGETELFQQLCGPE